MFSVALKPKGKLCEQYITVGVENAQSCVKSTSVMHASLQTTLLFLHGKVYCWQKSTFLTKHCIPQSSKLKSIYRGFNAISGIVSEDPLVSFGGLINSKRTRNGIQIEIEANSAENCGVNGKVDSNKTFAKFDVAYASLGYGYLK